MKTVELLSPAKDKQTAVAAVNSGCDAIYIGAQSFGARKKAGNSLSDIKETVDYAHKFYVKVYVTINTIIRDDELQDVVKLINELYEANVDAIIIQDMAILQLALENKLPPILLHASTQCDNRTLEKIKFFENIGLSRVILARELSLEQIENICQNSDIEKEVFIHGALCVSYSGQCYLSHYIGGRSANRGECAQACRKKYSLICENGDVIAKDKYLLSLKDFNSSKYIERLVNAGVKSFKIEGRLKDENYVKNVTAYYRNEIDKYAKKSSSGKVFLDFEPDLNKSFNRGFCDYFLSGKRGEIYNFETPKSIGEYLGEVTKTGQNWFEISGDVCVNSQDGLYFDSQGCLVNKVEHGKIYPNKMDGIKCGVKIYRNFDSKFEKQLSNSKTKRQIAAQISVKNGKIYVKDEDNNQVVVELEKGEEAKNPQKMKDTFISQFNKTGEEDFYIEKLVIDDDIPFLPISKINELRRNLFKILMKERIKNYKRVFQKPLKYEQFPLKKLNYLSNIHNEKSKQFYEHCGCEVCEMSAEIGTKARELMRTKHCLKFAFNMCKSPKNLYLIDEKGEKFKLEFDCKNCEMIIHPCNTFGQ
ncbi:U32 family peptidase [bacterium]|nr:U32 family peptidase [bacterium]